MSLQQRKKSEKKSEKHQLFTMKKKRTSYVQRDMLKKNLNVFPIPDENSLKKKVTIYKELPVQNYNRPK